MGTRINVIFDHDLADWQDRSLVVQRLNLAISEVCQVEKYWSRVDPHHIPGEPQWLIDSPISPHHLDYTGPGAIFVSINPTSVRIHTGARWRGFLSIEPLHRVHLAAFRRIVRALGGTEMIVFSDDEDVNNEFWEGRSYSTCLEQLNRTEGPPQPTIETIDPKIVRDCEHGVPAVWYRERVTFVGREP